MVCFLFLNEAHLRCMKNEAELRSMKRAFGTLRGSRALRFMRALASASWQLNCRFISPKGDASLKYRVVILSCNLKKDSDHSVCFLFYEAHLRCMKNEAGLRPMKRAFGTRFYPPTPLYASHISPRRPPREYSNLQIVLQGLDPHCGFLFILCHYISVTEGQGTIVLIQFYKQQLILRLISTFFVLYILTICKFF